MLSGVCVVVVGCRLLAGPLIPLILKEVCLYFTPWLQQCSKVGVELQGLVATQLHSASFTGSEHITRPARIPGEGKSISLLAGGSDKATWQRFMDTKRGGILTSIFANSLPQQLYLAQGWWYIYTVCCSFNLFLPCGWGPNYSITFTLVVQFGWL